MNFLGFKLILEMATPSAESDILGHACEEVTNRSLGLSLNQPIWLFTFLTSVLHPASFSGRFQFPLICECFSKAIRLLDQVYRVLLRYQ